MPKIAIVAGEASGDLLGYHLIREIKSKRPDVSLFGIAGPKMMSLGVTSLYPIEKLSVRGYLEVLKHVWGLLKLRRALLKQIIAAQPDVFVGIDAPDFNFWLEKKLKARGIPTIHYVSPSIWAWRRGRIGGIKRAVNHMLALFPMEEAIYQKANIPVTYIGHPLADELPMVPKVNETREKLKIKPGTIVISMLPGSRQSEVKQHAELFIKTAMMLQHEIEAVIGKQVQFLVPLITRETRDIFESAWFKALTEHPEMAVDMQIMFGHAHDAMAAADVVIVASGTATLEAALLKKPMVITYRMPTMSWYMLKWMRYLPYVGLPNILAQQFIVPELIQKDANAFKMCETVINLLSDKEGIKTLKQHYSEIHHQLKQKSAKKAAEVVLSYIK